jgi:hypothetical protein
MTALKVIFVILFALWLLFGEVDYPAVYEGGTLNSYLRPGTPVDLQIRGFGLEMFGFGIFEVPVTIATKRGTNIGRPGTRNDVTGLSYKDGTVTITWWSNGNMKLSCKPDTVRALERATGRTAELE